MASTQDNPEGDVQFIEVSDGPERIHLHVSIGSRRQMAYAAGLGYRDSGLLAQDIVGFPDGRLRPNLRTNQLPGLSGSDKTQISSAGPRGDIIPYKPAVIWPQDKRTLAKESAHPTAWLVEKTAVVNDRPPTSIVKRRNQIFMKT